MTHSESTARPECVQLVAKIDARLSVIEKSQEEDSKSLRELENKVAKLEALQSTQFNILRDVTKQVGEILIQLTTLSTHTEDFEKQLLEYRRAREEREARKAKEESIMIHQSMIQTPKSRNEHASKTDVSTLAKQSTLAFLVTKFPLGSGVIIGIAIVTILLLMLVLEAEAIKNAFGVLIKRIGG